MSDLDRYQYGYDPNSNRLYKANVVGTPVVSGGLDECYSYDNLNRLTVMQRGVLNGTRTGISGTPSREMDYTLDPTGNWSAYLTKTNGTTDLNQTRTANTVNEITAIGGTPGWATPPAYDAAGNMISFPQPASPASNFTATYDAWNQMTSISNTSGGALVASYQYDGRGRRIVKYTASSSETRHFYYTNSWQNIEERVGTATTMDKQYVWGVRYIDELVCRDDATPQRLYATQDANFNLTSIANSSGALVERYLFDPYGNRTIMNSSWGVISSSAYNWAIGHQGLMHDEEDGLIYNRARYVNPSTGRFMGRDPKQYVDGLNLYEYVRSNPVRLRDFNGRKSSAALNPMPCPCNLCLKLGSHGAAFGAAKHTYISIEDCKTGKRLGTISGEPGNHSGITGIALGFGKLVYAPDGDLSDGTTATIPITFQGSACDFAKCLEKSANAIDAAGIDYQPNGPNSNTFAHAVLEKCGGSANFPWNAVGSDGRSGLGTVLDWGFGGEEGPL